MVQQLNDQLISQIIDIRPKLTRVIAGINGKGGQGKTTCTSQLSGLMSSALDTQESDQRVLAIDMDPQGNLGLDLGYIKSDQDDQGASILSAIAGLGKLTPIRNVRPNLDVIPGGDRLHDIPGIMYGRQGSGGREEARIAFARALAEIAHEYDWILIDCPPLERTLQDIALVAARWALIPISFDEGSRMGMEGISKRFISAQELNPELELLGVVMYAFAFRPGKDGVETGQRARIRAQIKQDLQGVGSQAPVFNTVIRRMDSVAEAARKRGQLLFELEQATDGPKWWDVRAGRATGWVLPTDRAATLAEEFQALAAEVFGRVLELEEEPAA